jgi:hypothetical protein
MKEIAFALVKAQSEMSNPTKGATNPFFKSKYADLNSVREAVIHVLNSNGISVLQPMVNIDGKNFIKTVFLHVSGEQVESFTEIIYSKQNDAQSQGSGITYARRYGLQSLACVGAEDDDGNAASKKDEPKKEINTPERNPDLTLACGEMRATKNTEEFKKVWSSWKRFQTDTTFITCKDLQKEKLNIK